MAKERVIPDEILDELDINKVEKEKDDYEITPLVERHQVKLPIPALLRKDIKIEKGKKIKVRYDPKKKELIYKI